MKATVKAPKMGRSHSRELMDAYLDTFKEEIIWKEAWNFDGIISIKLI